MALTLSIVFRPQTQDQSQGFAESRVVRLYATTEASFHELLPDVALPSQALRVSGPVSMCASRLAGTGLVG